MKSAVQYSFGSRRGSSSAHTVDPGTAACAAQRTASASGTSTNDITCKVDDSSPALDQGASSLQQSIPSLTNAQALPAPSFIDLDLQSGASSGHGAAAEPPRGSGTEPVQLQYGSSGDFAAPIAVPPASVAVEDDSASTPATPDTHAQMVSTPSVLPEAAVAAAASTNALRPSSMVNPASSVPATSEPSTFGMQSVPTTMPVSVNTGSTPSQITTTSKQMPIRKIVFQNADVEPSSVDTAIRTDAPLTDPPEALAKPRTAAVGDERRSEFKSPHAPEVSDGLMSPLGVDDDGTHRSASAVRTLNRIRKTTSQQIGASTRSAVRSRPAARPTSDDSASSGSSSGRLAHHNNLIRQVQLVQSEREADIEAEEKAVEREIFAAAVFYPTRSNASVESNQESQT